MAVSAVKKEPAKSANSSNQDPAAGAGKTSAEGEAPSNSGKRKKLLIGLLLVVAAGAGGASWYFSQNQNPAKQDAKAHALKPPVFVPLENFTVNLQIEDAPQFLQVGLSLKATDSKAADLVKLHMPEIRDRILLLLSSKKSSELLTLDGKKKLAAQITAAINSIIAPSQPSANPEPKPAAPPDGAAEEPPAGDAAEKGVADAADNATPAAAPDLPVQTVLFTSFIVQ